MRRIPSVSKRGKITPDTFRFSWNPRNPGLDGARRKVREAGKKLVLTGMKLDLDGRKPD